MRRLAPVIVVLLLLLLLAYVFWPAPSTPTATPAQANDLQVRVTQIDTRSYPTVTVYVAVDDAAGQPQTSLPATDFALTEDGASVDITSFTGGGAINTALLIDRSGSMSYQGKMRGAQAAARTFVGQMRAGDQITLIAFDDDAMTAQRLTSDRKRLAEAIDRLYADGGTSLYDSAIAGIDALRSVGGRRVVLVLTDGQDCRDIDCYDSTGSRASLDALIDYAQTHEQPLYVVGLGSRSNPADIGAGINEAALQRMAEETYGAYFYTPDVAELAALYAELSSELQHEYALTYTSPRPFYDGTRRDIRVGVGDTISAGVYTERHLINVQSHLLVGLLLLLPLIGLLLLPGIVAADQRSGRRRLPNLLHRFFVGAAANATPAPAPQRTAAPRTARAQPLPAPERQPRAVACSRCGAPLRPGSRFCGICGAITITGQAGNTGQTDHPGTGGRSGE